MNSTIETAEEIFDLFKSILKTYHQYILSQVSCHNFTVPQLMVLHELYYHPEITLTELSERVNLSKSTVSGIVARLELHGVLKRIKVSNDRRIVKISLTEKVSEIQEKVDAIRKNYLAELFKNIAISDLDKILFGLKQLDNLMKKIHLDEPKSTGR